MIRTKPLDMGDLMRNDFNTVMRHYDKFFGPNWPSVPCRRWEYVAAIMFSEILTDAHDHRGNIKVCDAGSGSRSAFTHYLGHSGFNVDAFDINVSGTVNLENGAEIKYRNMSLINIGFPSQHFDYVFCMSAIEHVNAPPKFSIPELAFDTGDTTAMLELCRILKPGGILVVTTDYAKTYVPPPGPVKSGKRNGCHRVYNWDAILDRLINPAVREHQMRIWGGFESECDWKNIHKIEPVGWPYTEFIFTLRKKSPLEEA